MKLDFESKCDALLNPDGQNATGTGTGDGDGTTWGSGGLGIDTINGDNIGSLYDGMSLEDLIAYSEAKYANMLAHKIKEHNVNVWLVNTGWIGGPYGIGNRINIKYTRTIIDNINNNTINTEYTKMPMFNFDIPNMVGDIPEDILFPWMKWETRVNYINNLTNLSKKFISNFEKYNLPDLAQNGGPIL